MLVNKKILIIDDNATQLQLYCEILAPTGAILHTEFSPENGIEKLLNGTYHLLILDMKMPEINGIQFLSKMLEKKINVPVLIVSSVDDKTFIIKTMEKFKCVKQFLVKDTDLSLLEDTVKRILFPK